MTCRHELNQQVVLKRNEAYQWAPPALNHKGPPDIAEITFQIVTTPQARVNQFQTGVVTSSPPACSLAWTVGSDNSLAHCLYTGT